jgi:hypothetical protein
MRTIKLVTVAFAMLAMLWLAGPAAAQDPYGPDNPPGGGVGGANQGRDGGEVSGVSESDEDDGEGLPFTGAEITMYSVIGLGAIGTGVLILRRTRAKANA